MKHFLRYSLMCVLSILWGTTFAQTEVKFDFDNGDAALFGLPGVSCNADEANGIAESHDGDFTQDATATKDGVSITVSAAEEGAKNANRIWNKSAVLRMYSGSLTIEAPGHKITKLVINYSKDKWQADSKPDVGAFISSTDQTTIWSGSSSKVVIKIAGNSQMKDITVTLDGESGGQGSGDTNYGTAEAPLTVAEALTIATALDADASTSEDVFTKGVVTEITTAWSSQYNNVSFNISNDGGNINLLVYRCKSEAEDYVLVGDEVIIKGKLKNYKGNTPEYDAGCEIVSLVPGDGHDTTPHTDVKFDFDNGDAALFGLPGVSCNADEANGIPESHDGDFTQDATATKDGVSITVSAAEEGAKNANRIWNKSAVLRMYSGWLTVEAPGRTITKLVINYSKDKWQADSKPDVGEFTSSTNQTTIWEGSSSKVVIKIAGNSQITDITVTLDGESGGQGGDTNYGTAEAPLTVAEALAIATALDKDAKTPEDVDVYTKGVVTEITTEWSSQYNNVSFNISNDGGTTTLLVFRCKAESADYVLVGDEVVIKGKLKNYRGDTPEYDAGCEIISMVQGSGHSGTIPDTPEEINVAKAVEIIISLEPSAKTEKEYIVTGYVVSDPDFQRKADGTLYGNVNLEIADAERYYDTSANIYPMLTIFRAKSYENAPFTEETLNLFKAGDKVVFQGKLQRYVKDEVETPELVNGYLIKVEPTTGIQNVKISATNGAIYNLAGQRVEKATKGIYIQNGRKFVVK